MLNFRQKLKDEKNKKTPILISYRQEGSKHLGAGPFFDHYTLQQHTGFPTRVVHEVGISISSLKSYVQTQATHNLPYSPQDPTIARPFPAEVTQYQISGGLLVIPGMTRDSYEHPGAFDQKRMQFEGKILQDAINRGRPIIAICAGSWKLWQTLGGQIIPVTDHVYSRMPSIGAHGNVVYNVEMHDVNILENSLLQKAMKVPNTGLRLTVNSVHWNAPSSAVVPPNFQIAATAVRNPHINLQNRHQQQILPQEGTVEAFESKHGAPIFGFGWHPEAEPPHHRALLFMAKAGNAFQARQAVNTEFSQKVKQVKEHNAEDLEAAFKKLAL